MLPQMATLHKDAYPIYFDEVCGMAAGIGVPAAQVRGNGGVCRPGERAARVEGLLPCCPAALHSALKLVHLHGSNCLMSGTMILRCATQHGRMHTWAAPMATEVPVALTPAHHPGAHIHMLSQTRMRTHMHMCRCSCSTWARRSG